MYMYMYGRRVHCEDAWLRVYVHNRLVTAVLYSVGVLQASASHQQQARQSAQV